jgi:hypothetical protein
MAARQIGELDRLLQKLSRKPSLEETQGINPPDRRSSSSERAAPAGRSADVDSRSIGVGAMETTYLVLNTFAMPLPGLPFPRAPYRHGNRGHIIAYHSSRAELVS